MAGWHHDNVDWKPVTCATCGVTVNPKSGNHKYCSAKCKRVAVKLSGKLSTDAQYEKISGDWSRYLPRLLYFGGRRRDSLTREILLGKLESQGYKCALTGVPLTCNLQKGVDFPTNVSVDRIIPGGPYTEDNIQLVCKAVNYWRNTLSVDEFVQWCRKVVEHADSRTLSVEQGKGDQSHGETA